MSSLWLHSLIRSKKSHYQKNSQDLDCNLFTSGWLVFSLCFLVFAGYEGVPEFFNDLLNHISSVLQSHSPDFVPASEQSKGLPVSTTVPSSTPPALGCCSSMRGKDMQRLGCNSAVSPNFQQHCVSTIATKASSQWLSPYPTVFDPWKKKTNHKDNNNNDNNQSNYDVNISNQNLFPI